jgi:ankyrin repeat protein
MPVVSCPKKEKMNEIDQELIDAAAESNVPEVRRLLSDGADVNAEDNRYGLTPLIEASGEGHVQVVNELLEHGADIEKADSYGRTPLIVACCFGCLAVAIELLGHEVDIDANYDSSNGATTSILGKRKSRGGANTEARDNDGDTPLSNASRNGHLAIVKALLSGGANILAANNQGTLPIHFAVRERHSEVAKCLLQHFYSAICDIPLRELLDDLTWIGNPFNSSAPPLRFALDRNVLGTDDVVEILEYLVGRNPALLSSRDRDGSLPLHVACCRGASFTIVQSLVNLYKASVKSRTSEGDLPLFLACEMPETSLDTIFLLMKLYPDVVYR